MKDMNKAAVKLKVAGDAVKCALRAATLFGVPHLCGGYRVSERVYWFRVKCAGNTPQLNGVEAGDRRTTRYFLLPPNWITMPSAAASTFILLLALATSLRA